MYGTIKIYAVQIYATQCLTHITRINKNRTEKCRFTVVITSYYVSDPEYMQTLCIYIQLLL